MRGSHARPSQPARSSPGDPSRHGRPDNASARRSAVRRRISPQPRILPFDAPDRRGSGARQQRARYPSGPHAPAPGPAVPSRPRPAGLRPDVQGPVAAPRRSEPTPSPTALAARADDAEHAGISHVPLVGQITASIPIPTQQELQTVLAMPRAVVGHGDLVALSVIAQSVFDAGIRDVDITTTRRQPAAGHSDIVALSSKVTTPVPVIVGLFVSGRTGGARTREGSSKNWWRRRNGKSAAGLGDRGDAAVHDERVRRCPQRRRPLHLRHPARLTDRRTPPPAPGTGLGGSRRAVDPRWGVSGGGVSQSRAAGSTG